jgi:hypothetical protein
MKLKIEELEDRNSHLIKNLTSFKDWAINMEKNILNNTNCKNDSLNLDIKDNKPLSLRYTSASTTRLDKDLANSSKNNYRNFMHTEVHQKQMLDSLRDVSQIIITKLNYF